MSEIAVSCAAPCCHAALLCFLLAGGAISSLFWPSVRPSGEMLSRATSQRNNMGADGSVYKGSESEGQAVAHSMFSQVTPQPTAVPAKSPRILQPHAQV